jgi:hypothetical protein
MNYKLFNVAGQAIMTGATQDDSFELRINSSGMYMLKIEDESGYGVFRKIVITD